MKKAASRQGAGDPGRVCMSTRSEKAVVGIKRAGADCNRPQQDAASSQKLWSGIDDPVGLNTRYFALDIACSSICCNAVLNTPATVLDLVAFIVLTCSRPVHEHRCWILMNFPSHVTDTPFVWVQLFVSCQTGCERTPSRSTDIWTTPINTLQYLNNHPQRNINRGYINCTMTIESLTSFEALA